LGAVIVAKIKMKGEITKRLLEIITETTGDATDVIGAFLGAGYGASYARLDRERSRRTRLREMTINQREEEGRRIQRYRQMISYLKRDGLIRECSKEGSKFLAVTKKGDKRLALIKERAKQQLPTPSYSAEKHSNVTIVIFDIPERDRKKRRWLRSALVNMEIKMIQKSVWMGKIKMPQEFIDDLNKLKMTDFVEIFQVTKSGSLRHVA
jgi:DNA-binding transcriptional regulator PaaX